MKKDITPYEELELVTILWEDATLSGTHTHTEMEAKGVGLMTGCSSGVLVYENKSQITLAQDWFIADNAYRSVAVYPKSGIKQIVRHKMFLNMELDSPITHSLN